MGQNSKQTGDESEGSLDSTSMAESELADNTSSTSISSGTVTDRPLLNCADRPGTPWPGQDLRINLNNETINKARDIIMKESPMNPHYVAERPSAVHVQNDGECDGSLDSVFVERAEIVVADTSSTSLSSGSVKNRPLLKCAGRPGSPWYERDLRINIIKLDNARNIIKNAPSLTPQNGAVEQSAAQEQNDRKKKRSRCCSPVTCELILILGPALLFYSVVFILIYTNFQIIRH